MAMRLSVFSFVVASILLGAAYLPAGTSALTDDNFDLIFGTDLSLELSSQNLRPNDMVTITAHSLLLDLDAMTLTWLKDGEALEEGAGRTSVSVSVPALGNATEISLAVLEDGVERVRRNLIIRPVEIELLWEADSYVPPYFRGRALPSAGTRLRLEAKPHFIRTDGSSVQEGDIIFTWKRNGYVIQGVSGRGAARAVIEAPALFGTDTISVDARSADSAFGGEASVVIPSREPELVLYEKHPLFGVMNHRALSSETSLPSEELSLVAVPYFAGAAQPNDDSLLWEWKVNGNPIENDPERPSEITINARGSSGGARIDLTLSHVVNFFQNASGEWDLSLLRENAGNLFTEPLFEADDL